MNRKLLTGSLLLTTLSIVTLVQVEPAGAFSWNPDSKLITIDDGDAKGQYFDIFFFDAFAKNKSLDGLSAEARFTLSEDFNASTGTAKFKVDVTNNSNANVWDEASIVGLGFAVDPDLQSASSSGVFSKSYVGQQSTGVKDVEVCYSNGYSCTSGGQNGGIKLGETASFYTTLNFGNQAANGFNILMDKFYVSWKGDSTTLEHYGKADSYGEVPTPALIPGLIGAGLAAFRKKQKEDNCEETQQSV